MDTRGALILMTGGSPGFPGDPARARFGAADLLALTVGTVRPRAGHLAVVPGRGGFSPRYLDTYLKDVRLTGPVDEAGGLGSAIAAAAAAFPAQVSEILLLTADLPFLDDGLVAELFGGLDAACDRVGVVDGERRVPLLGACRRTALDGGRPFMEDVQGDEAAAATGPRGKVLRAAPAGGNGATVASRLDSPEAYRRALAHHGLCDPAHPAVTLELYGNLRIRTGCERLPLHGDTVRTALRVLRRVFPETARLLPGDDHLPEHFRFSINGRDVTTELSQPLREGDHVVLFSATVGG